MIVDRTTYADLEFFSTTSGDPSLFSFLDRCRTRAGSEILHRRFREPLSDADEIRAVQAAVAYWRKVDWTPSCDASVLAGLETYLNSKVAAIRTTLRLDAFLESLWVRIRYKAEYGEVEAGIQYVTKFLTYMTQVVDLLPEKSPRPLRQLRDRIQSVLKSTNLVRARSMVKRSPFAVLRADHVFRRTARRELEQLITLLGELDALWAMSDACRTLNLTMPEVADGADFLLESDGLFHLALPEGIANPVHISRGEVLVFITGPNMAGKSTYLRAVGVACLLAHCGMGVPANRFRFSPLDRLLTSLNPTDNLRRGLSYFMAEVDRVHQAATHLAAGERCFMMFDEVFRGTNVHDAMEASRAVITGFARSRTSGFIFASHLVELVGELENVAEIRFACFDGEIVAGVPTYEYTLREGTSTRRFGMLLLEQAKVPALLARIVDAR